MKPIIAALFISFASLSNLAQKHSNGNIRLLDGYKIKKARTVDALTWTIYKEGGLTIDFEAGPNEGLWADAQKQEDYLWYREQVLNGHKVMLALVKPGLRTVWEPDHPRSPELGNILLVTFPLGVLPDNTANFSAEILGEKELADSLLMILTFDPSNM